MTCPSLQRYRDRRSASIIKGRAKKILGSMVQQVARTDQAIKNEKRNAPFIRYASLVAGLSAGNSTLDYASQRGP